MARKIYTPEQITNKLREAEVHLSQGNSIGEASRQIEVTEQTYYRWRKEYVGNEGRAGQVDKGKEYIELSWAKDEAIICLLQTEHYQ